MTNTGKGYCRRDDGCVRRRREAAQLPGDPAAIHESTVSKGSLRNNSNNLPCPLARARRGAFCTYDLICVRTLDTDHNQAFGGILSLLFLCEPLPCLLPHRQIPAMQFFRAGAGAFRHGDRALRAEFDVEHFAGAQRDGQLDVAVAGDG